MLQHLAFANSKKSREKLIFSPLQFCAEAKQEFDGNCSVQVYSVQASVPKDPAALWNPEFVQAEELFKQSFKVDNCFIDNRLVSVRVKLVCAVPFVLHTVMCQRSF